MPPSEGATDMMSGFDLPEVVRRDHWHVFDHYTGDDRTYTDERLMRQWVRRHGGEGIVQIEPCDETRCLLEIVSP
jgi:hypothetical protein